MNAEINFSEEQKIIKDYQVVNYIGEGAFGQVFLVKHMLEDKHYAMKVQSKKLIEEHKSLDNVMNEQIILRSI